MSSPSEYQFGKCRVLSHAREIWLDGVQQEVPPRVFDLLLYLLKYSERVVSKQEILEEIWLGRVVTDNVVSRAIMIARSVIGDSKSAPFLIKTVQRVGYRFIGELGHVEGNASIAHVRAPLGSPVQRVIRTALLPYRNNTGRNDLAWVEFGLPTVVSQALDQDSRVEMLGISAVLKAIDDRPDQLSGKGLAERVMKGLGATCVIESSVSKTADGFAIDYLAYGQDSFDIAGRLMGADLVELANQLARIIGRHLPGEEIRSLPFHSDDPFVNECFARGMQALNQQDSIRAMDLLRAARQLEPDSATLALAYLSALSAAGHHDAVTVAEQLIERGRKSGDSHLENSARKTLAMTLVEDRRDPLAADEVLSRMFAMEPPSPMQDWYIEALITRARIRTNLGDRAVARDMLIQVLALCDENDNQMQRMAALNNRAVIEAIDDNLWLALHSFRELRDILAQMDRPLGCALTELNLAVTYFNLGVLDEAVAEGASAMRRMATNSNAAQKYPNAILSAATLFAQVHDTHNVARLAQLLKTGAWSEAAADNHMLLDLILGFECYSRNDLDAAAQFFLQGIEASAANGQRHHFVWIPFAMNLLFMAGRYDDAHRVRDLMDPAALPEFPWMPGALVHASAIEASLCGDQVSARERLESALSLAKGGFEEAFIRLDLAWVLLLTGETDAARTLCRQIEPWMTQHPAGLLVRAVLESRAAHPDDAERSMRRHLEMVGGENRSSFAGLLEQLSRARPLMPPVDLTDYAQLPSTYRLPKRSVDLHGSVMQMRSSRAFTVRETSLEQ